MGRRRRAPWRSPPGRLLEAGAIARREPEGLSQLAHRIGPGTCFDAAFQVADGADAQACALGQLFLGHTGCDPEVAEEAGEPWGWAGCMA